MLLGSAGVGKTSFKRSLMQLPWEPKTNSTILTDVEMVRPVEYELQKNWSPMEEYDEIEELAYLLATVYDDPAAASKLLSVVDGLSLYPDEDSSLPVSRDKINAKSKEVNMILSKAIERANHTSPIMLQKLHDQCYLHIWDCGGQPVFLEILPAFLTTRTMFLLLFNASKNFDELWESIRTEEGKKFHDGRENATTQELLLSWMANIHSHLVELDEDGGFREYPSAYCIGTHGDQLNDEMKDEVIAKVKSQYKSKAFADLIKDTLIVDNTTAGMGKDEDPNFEKIRFAIQDFAMNDLAVRVPVSWVLFRKVIQIFNEKVISLEDALAIGVACEIPRDHVLKVLRFYHDLGALLYYPGIAGLKNKVIIDPKWFVKVLGKILTLEGREEYKRDQMWSLFRRKGILVRPFYVSVWKNLPKECAGMKPDELIDLLVHFNLAAEVKTDEYYDENAKQFFVPAVLKSFKGNSSDVEPGYLQRPTFLHITFGTKFVSPGFFTRFATSMAKSEDFELFLKEDIFRNRIVFTFGVDYVVLSNLGYAIQVDVLRYAPNAVISFDEVCEKIAIALKKFEEEVDEVLNTSSTAKIKILKKFQYVCNCNTSEIHYLVTSSNQTCDAFVYCEKNKRYRQLTKNEALWFKKPTPKEVPNFICTIILLYLNCRYMYFLKHLIHEKYIKYLSKLVIN